MDDREQMKEDLSHLRKWLFGAASFANDVADTAKRMGDDKRAEKYRRFASYIYNDAEALRGDCDELGVERE